MYTKNFKINPYFIFLSLASFCHPSLSADQIANSSIDLKKDVESINQNDFKNKDNLEIPINDLQRDSEGLKREVSQKTILLRSVNFKGNRKYSDKKLSSFFKNLLGKDITFSQLANASREAQSLYRKNGYITSRVILPKQDFLSGNVQVVVIESYLEDIIVKGGNDETRKYIQYMTNNVLKNNQKNKIFNFEELERQLLLIKKTNIAQLTSTLSKGSTLGSSLLTIEIDPSPIAISAFSNNEISENLGEYVVGLKSSYTTKSEKPLKIGFSSKVGIPDEDGNLISGVLLLDKPLGNSGLTFRSTYANSNTTSKDLFPNTAGKSINKSESDYFSFGLSYPLILRRNTELELDVSTSIQNSSQDFYQDNVFSNNVSTDKIRALRVGLNGRKSLKNSFNTARFLYSQGYEGFNDKFSSNEIRSNPNSNANFSTYKLDLVRQQFIGKDGLSLQLRASGQLATEPLPTPEKFSFGGPGFGRGFKSSHIFGDAGFAASAQLSKNLYFKKGKSITTFTWIDFGQVDDLTGETRELSATTYGVGFGGRLNPDLTYQFSIGVPGDDDSNPTKVGLGSSIFNFNVGFRF